MSLSPILPLPLPRSRLPRLLHRAVRFSSASPHLPASSVAASFLSRFQSLGPQTQTQILDANQLNLLTLTLNRPSLFPATPALAPSSSSSPSHTPVPPGYHLVYFTPAFLETELGADGTDASYNPESPFTRRMWAGGEVSWPRDAQGRPNPLRVGQQVTETTRVLSAEAKVVKKTGEDMVVVGVEKEFSNENGVSIVDRRYVLGYNSRSPTPTNVSFFFSFFLQKLGLSQGSTYAISLFDSRTVIILTPEHLPSDHPESYLIGHRIRGQHPYTHSPPNPRHALPFLRTHFQPTQNPLLSTLGTRC